MYYTHTTTVNKTVDGKAVFVDVTKEYYLYSHLSDVNLVLDLDPSDKKSFVNSSLYTPSKDLKLYEDGVLKTTYPNVGFFLRSARAPAKYTKETFIQDLQIGLLDHTYFDELFSSDMKNIINIKLNTLDILDEKTGEVLVYSGAKADPEKLDGYIVVKPGILGLVRSGSQSLWEIELEFKVPKTTNIKDWTIKHFPSPVKGQKGNTFITSINDTKDYYIQTIRNRYYVPYQTNMPFQVSISNGKDTYTSKVYRISNFEGFVDNDGDGLDDRSGQDETAGGVYDGEYSFEESLKPGNFPGGFDYENGLDPWSFTTFFSNIGKIISNFTNSIKILMGHIGDMFSIFSVVTSVIPAEIIALLTASVLLLIILKIFNR